MTNRNFSISTSKTTTQLIRYGIVGILTNTFLYITYLGVTYLGGTPKITMTFLYLLSACISFYINMSWTFPYKNKMMSASIRYAFMHCCGYAINLITLFIFVDKLGYPHQWTQAFAIIMIAVLLFLMQKIFVFPEQSTARGN